MYDRKIQKGYVLRSIRRALWYLDDVKRQSFSPEYNRGIDYKRRAKDEIRYAMDILSTHFR
jgi:hypothetical protein